MHPSISTIVILTRILLTHSLRNCLHKYLFNKTSKSDNMFLNVSCLFSIPCWNGSEIDWSLKKKFHHKFHYTLFQILKKLYVLFFKVLIKKFCNIFDIVFPIPCDEVAYCFLNNEPNIKSFHTFFYHTRRSFSYFFYL